MKLILVAHNLRSCYNVGSLLRTCDGLGASMYMTGTTPYPPLSDDPRLPHVARRAQRQIAKTALGAEQSVSFSRFAELSEALQHLQQLGYQVAAIEQAPHATTITDWSPNQRQAIVVGSEPTGLEPAELELFDQVVEIPMQGDKGSFNVTIASAIALWQLNQK